MENTMDKVACNMNEKFTLADYLKKYDLTDAFDLEQAIPLEILMVTIANLDKDAGIEVCAFLDKMINRKAAEISNSTLWEIMDMMVTIITNRD